MTDASPRRLHSDQPEVFAGMNKYRVGGRRPWPESAVDGINTYPPVRRLRFPTRPSPDPLAGEQFDARPTPDKFNEQIVKHVDVRLARQEAGAAVPMQTTLRRKEDYWRAVPKRAVVLHRRSAFASNGRNRD